MDSNSMDCKDSMGDTPPEADCVILSTPEAVMKNGDFQSPLTLTVVREQLNLARIGSRDGDGGGENNDNSHSPRTPKDGVFDPFAPGPDNMAKAPQSNKYPDESRSTAVRRLDFHPSFHAESLSDEDMVESVYENLLQFIVSKQAEWFLAQMSNDSDQFVMPPSPPGLNGIADSCPGAPMKPPPKPRNIPVELCKKLEF